MNNYLILCVDDEREVLDSVINDLSSLESHFIIEAAESVAEAKALLQEAEHYQLALILCDHIMPKELGVDFLIELNNSPKTAISKKILLTGQAGLEDTIQAVNHANLDYFINKPWTKEALLKVVIENLTQFMIEHDHNLAQWLTILDTQKIMNAISENRLSYSDN